MLVGYARTSTLDQTAGLEGQERDLRAAGCERLFVEQVSSVDVKERAKLAEALAYVREGDTLVVTKLDRLARSVAHLLDILDTLTERGAALRVLDLNLDTGTPTGRLLLTVLGGIAQFEREIMLERQREGIAKAKAAGKYKGRKPTARAKADEVLKLHREGVGGTEIARRVGIGRASVYRILNEADGVA
ncbi:recombinase family protein [Rhodovulum adriaticum]|uniref:DNA invertase Pin-like site-specific DNA recombinase n=1 Tax=Rhodovulum adriaticum TaxID=35804 RepID=A0A4R2NI72_RHOAD|nr:recombinase family protein [Rhodovulum adriaticum]MBK1637112.1 DNA invertase [Rhodovulum adriaticum]TCP20885.1 DNA invertase Pin-like site-specific DNA recombinase [Rhodovulum adriaticum]